MVAVYTVGCHGIEGIRHSYDPAVERDILPLEPFGISFPVVALMVISGPVSHMLHQSEVLQYLCSSVHMGFHLGIFLIGQPAHLIQHTVRDPYLSYIVQLCRFFKIGYLLFSPPPLEAVHLLSDHCRVLCHTLRMLMGTHVLGIDRPRYGHDCFVCHVQLDLLLVQLSLYHEPGEPYDDDREQNEHVKKEIRLLIDLALFHQIELALLQHPLSGTVKDSQTEDVVTRREICIDDIVQAVLRDDSPLSVIALQDVAYVRLLYGIIEDLG